MFIFNLLDAAMPPSGGGLTQILAAVGGVFAVIGAGIGVIIKKIRKK